MVLADNADAFLVTAVADGTPGVFLVAADADGVSVEIHRDAEWVAPVPSPSTALLPSVSVTPVPRPSMRPLRRAVALGRIAQGGRAVGLMETALKTTVEYQPCVSSSVSP